MIEDMFVGFPFLESAEFGNLRIERVLVFYDKPLIFYTSNEMGAIYCVEFVDNWHDGDTLCEIYDISLAPNVSNDVKIEPSITVSVVVSCGKIVQFLKDERVIEDEVNDSADCGE